MLVHAANLAAPWLWQNLPLAAAELKGARVRAQPQDKAAIAGRETERTEAAAQLERKMAAMEAALAARRQPVGEAKPEAARGPGADLRFQVRMPFMGK